MKSVKIGDVHLSDKPPRSCTDSYTDDQFDLLYQIYDLIRTRNDIDVIVQSGDFFHIKRADRTSHRLVQRAIDWAQQSPVPIFVVPGNHDMAFDRKESVYDTQPLGVVAQSGAVQLLDGWADEYPIFGLPWLQSWDDTTVQEALASFRAEPYSPHNLVVTHAPLFPIGQEPPYEFYDVRKFAKSVVQGSVYYGHIHDPHGTYTVEGVQFCNNGALSRGSLTESNMNRAIGVTIWDSETKEFEFVALKYKPASEVFNVEEVLSKRATKADLNRFLESVGTTSLEINSIDDILADVKTRDLEPELLAKVEELLQGAWDA